MPRLVFSPYFITELPPPYRSGGLSIYVTIPYPRRRLFWCPLAVWIASSDIDVQYGLDVQIDAVLEKFIDAELIGLAWINFPKSSSLLLAFNIGSFENS
jgi:hypothetical protein